MTYQESKTISTISTYAGPIESTLTRFCVIASITFDIELKTKGKYFVKKLTKASIQSAKGNFGKIVPILIIVILISKTIQYSFIACKGPNNRSPNNETYKMVLSINTCQWGWGILHRFKKIIY